MLALIRRHFPAAHSCYAGPAITVHVPLPLTQAATGRLRCEGTVDYIGTRTALAKARLMSDDGKLFAQATSNCLIIRPGSPG